MLEKLQLLDQSALEICRNNRVVVRLDLNVPLDGKSIMDTSRIKAIIPTLQKLLSVNAGVIILSHLGRPKSSDDAKYSLAPVAAELATQLRRSVRLQKNWLKELNLNPGQVVLCENIRFHKGETNNDYNFAKQLSNLADFYVVDAFSCIHRAHASTAGIIPLVKHAFIGKQLELELQALNKALINLNSPSVAIVGGAKVSTKISVLKNLLAKVDTLIVGGGIANTMLLAKKIAIGKSLAEPENVQDAVELFEYAQKHNKQILLPQDVTTATELDAAAETTILDIHEIKPEHCIIDIGPKTISNYQQYISDAQTIIWNGPLGIFEWDNAASGTQALAEMIKSSSAYSLAGGGETVAAITKFGVADGLSYISTGGGAFLEYIEGKEMPSLVALQSREQAPNTQEA